MATRVSLLAPGHGEAAVISQTYNHSVLVTWEGFLKQAARGPMP